MRQAEFYFDPCLLRPMEVVTPNAHLVVADIAKAHC